MTNTVTWPDSTWVNADGLPVRFGRGNQVDAVVGYPAQSPGDDNLIVADIVFERLPAFSADEAHGVVYGGYPNVAIPKGAYIKSAILTPTRDFTGTGATLSLGLVTADGTEIDNDGLFDALAQTSMQVADGAQTGAGALVGTVLTTTGYLWATVQTASFTDGHARLVVTYFIPAPDANNT